MVCQKERVVLKPIDQRKLESGFALPIAVGVGFIMILLATTMIIRSNQSQISSLSQRSSNQSLAAAESGVAQFIAFFNKYRVFTGNGNRALRSVWGILRQNIQALPDCSDYAQPNQPNSGENLEAAPLESVITDFSQAIAVDPADPEKGSYRLIGYDVAGADRVLKIQGIAGDKRDTSVTDLEVKFPVDGVPINPTEPNTVPANCGSLATSLAAADNPTLPINDFSALERSITAPGFASKPVAASSLIGQTLPLSGDADGMTYILSGDLNMGSGDTITIASDKVVFLVTNDDIQVNADQAIRTETNASLFIVSYGNVTIRGSAEQPIVYEPSNALESLKEVPLHVFLGGEGTLEIATPDINLTADLPIVAYAPFGTVNFGLNSNTTSKFKGEVWAKSFQTLKNSNPDPTIFSRLSDLSANPLKTVKNLPSSLSFWKARLDVSQLKQYSIRPINSWKRENTP